MTTFIWMDIINMVYLHLIVILFKIINTQIKHAKDTLINMSQITINPCLMIHIFLNPSVNAALRMLCLNLHTF